MSLKVFWSKKASKELNDTATFWTIHNASDAYSRRLSKSAVEASIILGENPNLGAATNIPNVRFKLIETHFLLLYRINRQHITIPRFWDTHRNPKSVSRYFK